jgi:MerR family copper efflux transcriptional regulator
MTTMTIGELAKRVGLRTSALRYYEEQGLLTPVDRTEAGYRLYDSNAEQTLRFIQRAQRLGFSLGDIHSLLRGWQEGDLTDETIIETAKERYFALERQATQLLVLQHELGLFLQDMRQNAAGQTDSPAASLFHRLVDQVCANPLNQPAETVFDWLMTSTGCILTSTEGQALLTRLKGQHVHIWQEANDYHILVVSDDPEVGTAVKALAQLEANCQAHTYLQSSPEFISDDEGYLLVARGKNAFIFARLFLALEHENS